MAWDYILKKKNPYLAKLPKGESLTGLQKRVYDFLKKIDKKYQGKNIIIVSHELPLTVLEKTLKSWSIKEIIEWRKKNRERLIKTGRRRKIEFKKLPFNEKMEIDFHRPYIDGVRFYCSGCKEGLMVRVPEVIDCWFDSGSMPFAQYHYPFENQKLINNKIQFPADYISEGVDQTRGWFYTLLAISTLLGKGPAYKNVISLGHVLDEKGEKMSKSKGNVVDPWYIVEKYGADATRWYFYTINQPGDSKLFSEKDVEKNLKKFILTFWNSFAFYQTYKEGLKVKTQSAKLPLKTKNLLDQWILSRLQDLIQETTKLLDKYDVTAAARSIENFVINDLSLWYIRRSRKRFKEAAATLNFVLLTLSKLTAPFIPFLSEKIYQRISYFPRWNLGNSVHLEDWPKGNKKLIDRKLERKMERVREIVSLTLAARAKAKIKIRQPLAGLQIANYELRNEPGLLELIKEEVNVKKIIFGRSLKLETKITPELKEEGMIREVIRNIQEMRKEAGFKPKDKISVRYFGNPALNEILKKNEKLISTEGKIKDFQLRKEKQIFDFEKTTKVDQENLWLAIKKI